GLEELDRDRALVGARRRCGGREHGGEREDDDAKACHWRPPSRPFVSVMGGLAPPIPLSQAPCSPYRDARVKPGHDEGERTSPATTKERVERDADITNTPWCSRTCRTSCRCRCAPA